MTSEFTTKLQSSKQCKVAPKKKKKRKERKKHRSMGQDRKPRDKPMYL